MSSSPQLKMSLLNIIAFVSLFVLLVQDVRTAPMQATMPPDLLDVPLSASDRSADSGSTTPKPNSGEGTTSAPDDGLPLDDPVEPDANSLAPKDETTPEPATGTDFRPREPHWPHWRNANKPINNDDGRPAFMAAPLNHPDSPPDPLTPIQPGKYLYPEIRQPTAALNKNPASFYKDHILRDKINRSRGMFVNSVDRFAVMDQSGGSAMSLQDDPDFY